jgi:hypothetical protein
VTLLRIREVVPLEGFRLRLRLTNDAVVERDVSELMRGPVFEELRRKPEMFRDVRVEGGTVVWGNGADLCPDVLIWGGPPPSDSEAVIAVAMMRAPQPESGSHPE